MIELIIGIILILLAPGALLPRFIRWYEDQLLTPQWRAMRQIRPLQGMFDAHYELSKKVLRVVLAPFFFLLGLALIIAGIQELS